MNTISVATQGASDSDLASSLRMYIPKDMIKDANLEPGDTFEYKVVNNKVAIRYCPKGDLVLNENSTIFIKASAFLPPLRKKNTMKVEFVIKDGWLAFQVPTEFEYRPKGFGLLRDHYE